MFALEGFGVLLLVGVLVAVLQRRSKTNVNCGPMNPCLGRREKGQNESASRAH